MMTGSHIQITDDHAAMLSPEVVKRVQESFAKVTPIVATAAELFYGKLFELDPSLRALFTGDMKAQGTKLMETIGVVVSGLSHFDTLVPEVQALGRRHVGYGVQDGHYDTVATALLWTLKQGLGDDFTPECEAAWSDVYERLAIVMKGAAAKAVA